MAKKIDLGLSIRMARRGETFSMEQALEEALLGQTLMIEIPIGAPEDKVTRKVRATLGAVWNAGFRGHEVQAKYTVERVTHYRNISVEDLPEAVKRRAIARAGIEAWRR